MKWNGCAVFCSIFCLIRCAICMTDFEEGEDIRRLPCLHPYHVKCIDRWLKTNRICPVCRIRIDE
eukprot:m.9739 g.9739  ORF g.9739 m.9739 type:complete len:65 (+) comp21600_c0_seq1:1134-1328(+)